MAEPALNCFAGTNGVFQQVVIAKFPTWRSETMIPKCEPRTPNLSDVDINKDTLPVCKQLTPSLTQEHCSLDTVCEIDRDIGSEVESVLRNILIQVDVGDITPDHVGLNTLPKIVQSDETVKQDGCIGASHDCVSETACFIKKRGPGRPKKVVLKRYASPGTDPYFVTDKSIDRESDVSGQVAKFDPCSNSDQSKFTLPAQDSLISYAQTSLCEPVIFTPNNCVQTANYVSVTKDNAPIPKRRCVGRPRLKDEPTVNKQYSCSKCNLKFTQEVEMSKHIAVHHRIRRCSFKGRSVSNKQKCILDCHANKCRTKKIVKNHNLRQILTRNKTPNEHGIKNSLSSTGSIRKGRVIFQCKSCVQEFSCKQDFSAHTCLHQGRMNHLGKENGSCELKPITKDIVTANTDQNSTVTDEKPCKCIQCGAAFRQKNHLALHVRAHNGSVSHVRLIQKPVRSNNELKTTVKSGSYDKLASDHINSSRPTDIGFNNSVYVNKSSLKPRLPGRPRGIKNRSHTCYECNAVFKRRLLLDMHAVEQHGLEQNSCKKCYASFIRENELQRHIRYNKKKCKLRQSKIMFIRKSQHILISSSKEKKDSLKPDAESRTKGKNYTNKGGRIPYTCHKCRELFDNRRALVMHNCQNTLFHKDSEYERNGVTPNINDSEIPRRANGSLNAFYSDANEISVSEKRDLLPLSGDIPEPQNGLAGNEANIASDTNCENNFASNTGAVSDSHSAYERFTNSHQDDCEKMKLITQTIEPGFNGQIQSIVKAVLNEVVDRACTASATKNSIADPEVALNLEYGLNSSVHSVARMYCKSDSKYCLKKNNALGPQMLLTSYVHDEQDTKCAHHESLADHYHKRNGLNVSVEVDYHHANGPGCTSCAADVEQISTFVNELTTPTTHKISLQNDILDKLADETSCITDTQQENVQSTPNEVIFHSDVSEKLTNKTHIITDTQQQIEQSPPNEVMLPNDVSDKLMYNTSCITGTENAQSLPKEVILHSDLFEKLTDETHIITDTQQQIKQLPPNEDMLPNVSDKLMYETSCVTENAQSPPSEVILHSEFSEKLTNKTHITDTQQQIEQSPPDDGSYKLTYETSYITENAQSPPSEVILHSDVPEKLTNETHSTTDTQQQIEQSPSNELNSQRNISDKLSDTANEITGFLQLAEQTTSNDTHGLVNADAAVNSSNLPIEKLKLIVGRNHSVSNFCGKRRRPGRPKGSKNGVYTCRECSSTFRKKSRLKKHLVSDGIGGYICNSYGQQTALNCHTHKENQVEISRQDKCHTTNPTPYVTDIFERLSYADFVQDEMISYKCYDCSLDFSYKHELELHTCLRRRQLEEPGMQQNGAVTSDTFAKGRQSSNSIKKKFAPKETLHKCDQCGATFVFEKNLQRHRLMYKCSTTATPAESKLACNLVETSSCTGAHLEQKLYKCGVCQVRFTSYGRLAAHLRSKRHRLADPKRHQKWHQYSCKVCNAKFVRRSDLSSHSLVHNVNTVSREIGNGGVSSSAPIDVNFKTGKERDDYQTQDAIEGDIFPVQVQRTLSSEENLHSFEYQSQITFPDIHTPPEETYSISTTSQANPTIHKHSYISDDIIDLSLPKDANTGKGKLVSSDTDSIFKWFDLFSDVVLEPVVWENSPNEYSSSVCEQSAVWPDKIIHLHACDHCENSLRNHTHHKNNNIEEVDKVCSMIETNSACDAPSTPICKLLLKAGHSGNSSELQSTSTEPDKRDSLIVNCTSANKQKLKTKRTRKRKRFQCMFCDAKFAIKVALCNHIRSHNRNRISPQHGGTAQSPSTSNTCEMFVADQQSDVTYFASARRASEVIHDKLSNEMSQPCNKTKCKWTLKSQHKITRHKLGRPKKDSQTYYRYKPNISVLNRFRVSKGNGIQSNSCIQSVVSGGRLSVTTRKFGIQNTRPDSETDLSECGDIPTASSASTYYNGMKRKRSLRDLYPCNQCSAKFTSKLSLWSHASNHKANDCSNKSGKTHLTHKDRLRSKFAKDRLRSKLAMPMVEADFGDLSDSTQTIPTGDDQTFNDASLSESSLRKLNAKELKNHLCTCDHDGVKNLLHMSAEKHTCICKINENAGASSTNVHEVVGGNQNANRTNTLVTQNALRDVSVPIINPNVPEMNCAPGYKDSIKCRGVKRLKKCALLHSCHCCGRKFHLKLALWNHMRCHKKRVCSDSGAVMEDTHSADDKLSITPKKA